MKTIIWTLIGLFLTSSAMSQCFMPNAQFVNGNLFPDPLNQWEYVDLHGSQSDDGFWFTAEKETTYLFTTLDEFGGGGASGDDYQITILDAQGSPVPGEYGSAFHDDVNYSGGESDPMLIWSPTVSGTYKLLLTRYYIGGCNEISLTDVVRVAYRGFMTSSSHVGVWTGVADNNAANGNNWMYVASNGQQLGYPPSGNTWQIIMDAKTTARFQHHSLVCDELFLGTNQVIELGANKTVAVNSKLFAPVQNSSGFFSSPKAGVIRSLNPQQAGTLLLKGQANEVVLAGQFQHINLTVYSDITLKNGGFNLFFPNKFHTIRSYTSTITLYDYAALDLEEAIWLNQQNSKFILMPHAVLNMADGASFGNPLAATGGGVSFEGGSVKWQVKNRNNHFTPVWAGNNKRAAIGFDLGQVTHTTVDVNYFTYQSPNTLPLNSPLVKVSSKEYFTVQPVQTGLSGRVIFKHHSGSGIGSTALGEIRLAGLTVQHQWEALISGFANGWIDAYPVKFDDYQRYTPASVGTSHSLRKAEPASELTLSVYPNPSHEVVKLTFEETDTPAMVRVVDMLGKEMLLQQIQPSEPINIEMLSPGRYQVQLFQGKKVRTASLIKI